MVPPVLLDFGALHTPSQHLTPWTRWVTYVNKQGLWKEVFLETWSLSVHLLFSYFC